MIAARMAKLVDNRVVAGSCLVSHYCSYLMHNSGYLVLKYQKALIRIRMQMEDSENEERKDQLNRS